MTLVALTTQNRTTITGHAGMCRNFMVFKLDGPEVTQQRVVELKPEQRFHEIADGTPHPLDGIDLLISGGMGAGLQQKLARRGIESLITSETDPLRALTLLVQGALPVLSPAAQAHHHDHEHGHAHDHGHPHAEGQRCAGCRCGH
ncbi:NifB/NifX family molybdenum-iron cluster-binding protein [Niveibacterium sp.]|uniref:NifB/NifX family molybdenum-iron cluster-binding protein n=1 Tax=Niveibacterium sp. TaxID=2017444 RepID=UPI0035B39CED